MRLDDVRTWIREQRRSRRLSAGAVSQELGMSPAWLDHIETGRREPTVALLERVVAHYGADLQFVITATGQRVEAVDTAEASLLEQVRRLG